MNNHFTRLEIRRINAASDERYAQNEHRLQEQSDHRDY